MFDDIVIVGASRLRVVEWLADDPYQQMALIPPQLAPDEWHTILDLAQYELAHGQ